VFAYFATAALCAWTARSILHGIPEKERGRQYLAWWLMTLFLIALGINKQLDLQSLFTAIGRQMAREQGWFDERRKIQFAFILGMMAAATLVMGSIAWAIRFRWREYGLMFVGVVFASSFIVIRAASFHHFESIRLGGVRLHRIIELGAILLLASAAGKRLWEIKRGQVRPTCQPRNKV